MKATTVWQKRKLSDLADMCLGKMLDQNKNKGEFLPYLANINVRWGSIDLDNLREMRFEEREFERYGLKYGDIVMCEGGEPGRCAIWKNQTPSMMIQKALHRISAKEGIDSFFLYYALLNKGLNGHFSGFFTGAAIKHLTGESLAKIELDIPPLSIQQKIAGILAAYDDLIENNLKRIKLLEDMAQITYEEWFMHLRFPGHESTPINPETGLPQGWETKAISTICDVNKNSITARNAPETIRYIDISSAETGYYTTPQEMAFTEAPSRARRRVAFGDTIFSTVRPNRRIFSLVLENDPLLVASTGFAVLSPHRAQNFPFIYLTISQQSFTDATVAVAGGAAYPAVNQTDFERIKITVPTQELMNKFSDAFVPYFTIKSQLQRKNALLREARDILLPRLMTDVIDVESYDPANLLKETA